MPTDSGIQWRRLATEAAAIVVSILLAFAIDAWWDERNDRVRLVSAIRNLTAEVADARIEIVRATQRNQDRIDSLKKFLSLSAEQFLELDANSISTSQFGPPSPFDTSGFALQGLLSGGNLEIISDDELRAALISWSQFPAEIERDYAEAEQFYMMRSERIAKHGVLAATRNERKNPSIPGSTSVREAFAAIRRDREIVDLTSQLIIHFEDFNDQLAEGIELADRVINASRQYVQ